MSQPSRLVNVAGLMLALVPWLQGCDSLLGELKPSADGAFCGVIYIYVDGGFAPTLDEGTSEAGAGGPPSAVDAGQGSDSVLDALVGIDLGALAVPVDADSAGWDGPLALGYDAFRDTSQDTRPIDAGAKSDVPVSDIPRDLPTPDARDARPDRVTLWLDAGNDSEGPDSSDSGADTPVSLVLDSASDASDARNDLADTRDAGPDQGADSAGDPPAIDTRDVAPDSALADAAADAFETSPPSVDVDVPGVVEQVTTGSAHSCALRADGSVFCWGANANGQGTPPAGDLFLQIDSAYYTNCGVRLDHTLSCWGSNSIGQATPPAGQFLQVAMGNFHGCGIKADGTVVCWGLNSNGQCTAPGGTFVQISAGSAHTCGIQTGGSILCWGSNGSGQSTAPSGVFTQLSARRVHTCAIRDDKVVLCMGSNSYGESTPPGGTFAHVGVGYWHSCGIRGDGTVVCWGSDSSGQSTPPAGGFLQVSGETDHTCGVRSNGSAACWGSDSGGQSSPP